MKASLLAGLLMTASLTALAQGKVNVVNDGASLVTFTTATSLLYPADVGLAGRAVGNFAPLPSGLVLMAGLYGGTSSSDLHYYVPNDPSQALMNNAAAGAGAFGFQVQLFANPTTGAIPIPGIANGTAIGAATPWFQVRVWDSAYATYELARTANTYIAEGSLFQFNPGPSLTYPLTAPANANSTWVDGPFGNFVVSGPEPSSAALVGLGAATLLMLRRRR